MASKEQTTATDLVRMITDELRLYPQFNGIVGVTVSATQQGPSNWKADYTIAATRSGPWPVFQEVDKLIRLFQDDFELAETS